jgi:hypothetical protein
VQACAALGAFGALAHARPAALPLQQRSAALAPRKRCARDRLRALAAR